MKVSGSTLCFLCFASLVVDSELLDFPCGVLARASAKQKELAKIGALSGGSLLSFWSHTANNEISNSGVVDLPFSKFLSCPASVKNHLELGLLPIN